jgi:hypothetical protein
MDQPFDGSCGRTGTLWSPEVLEYWGTGVMKYWSTGALESGILEYWGSCRVHCVDVDMACALWWQLRALWRQLCALCVVAALPRQSEEQGKQQD